MSRVSLRLFFFFFNAPAPTEIYTLSLHDALPICQRGQAGIRSAARPFSRLAVYARPQSAAKTRSEEHTSELQSRENLVCRLLLEKKNEGQCGSGRKAVTTTRKDGRELVYRSRVDE